MAITVAISATACSSSDVAHDATLHRVEIGYCALRISLPILVADREGFFRAHGLDVRLRRYETAQPLVEEVLDGRLDAGGYAALPIVLTAAARDGSEVRFATAMIEDEAHPISALLRRQGAPIPSVSDLRGRRVGILPTVAYQRWLDAVLREADVDPAEVTVTPLAPPQQAVALASGGVDALFTNDPMATAAIASGAGETVVPAPVPRALGGSLVFGSFLFHPRFAREHAGDARRIVAALDDAIAFIAAHQDRAREDMMTFVRPAERAYVRRYPDALYLPSDEATDARFTEEAQREHRLGILENEPSLEGSCLHGE